ncbi:MAG: S8 family serine peptidase [Spirochaetales bacterium]
MKTKNKQMNISKLSGLLLMGIIIAFMPVVANINMSSINTVYANSETVLSEEVEDEVNELDKKVFYQGTVEDDFADDKVIIVLNEEETHKFKTYAPEDFPEIDCIAIEDLTRYTIDFVEQEIRDREAGKEPKKIKKINVTNFRRILSLEIGKKSKEKVIKAIKKLENRKEIVSAEPNYVYSINIAPTDPFYDPIDDPNPNVADQWGLGNIKAEGAYDIWDEWDNANGSHAVNVAVMDTGIDGDHEDLENRISDTNPSLHRDFVTNSGGDVIENANLIDENGHGTHVAGIIAAEANNGNGIAGTTWEADVRLVSLRVGDANGNGDLNRYASAINFAAGQDIPIINCSMGGENFNSALSTAIYAYAGLFVASAGNYNDDNDISTLFNVGHYPASFHEPHIIAVGASHSDDTKWSDSNYGAIRVDIFAPGTGIWSTFPDDQYAWGDGTSQATPFVTGVAALIMSMKPEMDAIDIKDCILSGVDGINALDGLCTTGGRLNAEKALRIAIDRWEQPNFTSNTSHGTITASGTYSNEAPWKAFNGTTLGGSGGDGDQWSQNATSGFLQLELDDPIKVYSIGFYNGCSSLSNRTKDAKFTTGTGGVALGSPFTAPNWNFGYVHIPVGGVITNIIRLDISSSYGSYISASEIIINATEIDSDWIQPAWASASNSHGGISATSWYATEYPYKAFNGTMNGGSGGNGDQWSLNATGGWLKLTLDYYIKVESISFFNGISGDSNRTEDAYFTGTNDIALGSSFTALNKNFGHTHVDVGGVITNIIKLNVDTSYGSYINASAIVIDAKVVNCDVTLDNTGGTGGTASVTAINGQPMPTATAPTREGYTFGGYYSGTNGSGTQYYDADMDSVQNWDQIEDDILYAYWTIENYTINFDEEGGSAVANINEDYGTSISLPEPTRTGYIFDGWWSGDNGMGNMIAWTSMPDLGSDDATVTVYAKWIIENYTINFDEEGGSAVTNINENYGTAISLPTSTKTGYTFGGWWSGYNGTGTHYIWTSMPDLGNNGVTVTVYAKWTANTYTVILNKSGGIGGTSTITVTYGQAMPIATAPTKEGYDFVGYYTGSNGSGTKYYASDMTSFRDWDQTSGDILYAYWLPSGIVQQ